MMAQHDFKFFIDGKQYESATANITGADLRRIAQIPPTNAIFLEEHGHDKPDRKIEDNSSIDLSKPGNEKFYTVPPATFGMTL